MSNILVPYDGSPPAKKALKFALEQNPNSDFTVLYAVDSWMEDPPEENVADAFEDVSGLYEKREQDGRELLESAQRIAEEYDCEIETAVNFGPAHKVILDYADENTIEHIIIGSHGRSGVKRIFLGSVAEKVIRRAPVPVTIVR